MMIDIQGTAIINVHTNAVTQHSGKVFDINEEEITLDQPAIAAEVTRLQAEYDAQEYARDRAEAYPSIEDQLDKIYHDGIDAWKADIKAVKDEYPKP